MSPARWLWLALGAGFAFLYLPILLLILFSFNESRLVTVWSGFSLRWYGELAANARVLDAALLSLGVAAASATLATALGTMAGLALSRWRRSPQRLVFAGMVTTPLIMPEVITGLSLLLLFVTLEQLTGWPGRRGFTTIVIAHASFTLAYVAVIVQARLAGLDRSLADAALDLGARPRAVFWLVTLPAIAPAVIAGWLLAFTLSLDDLVIASFVSGPGATTLPMYIYSSVRLGLSPQINALASLMVLAVMLLVGCAAWLMWRRESARRRYVRAAAASDAGGAA